MRESISSLNWALWRCNACWPPVRAARLLGPWAAFLACTTTWAPALAQPSLRITAPADESLARPGESLKVTVVASGKFQSVMVIAKDPIADAFPKSAPPYDFTVLIPKLIDPGRYLLTAVGTGTPKGTMSKSITVIVEPTDTPMTLKVQPSVLRLSIGDKGSLHVRGVFADGQLC